MEIPVNNFDIKGLTSAEVIASKNKHGNNTIIYKKENPFFNFIKEIVTDPMVVLLLVASAIYFIKLKKGFSFL